MAFPWPSAGVGPAGGGTFAMWAPESQGGGAVSTVDGGTDDGGAGGGSNHVENRTVCADC